MGRIPQKSFIFLRSLLYSNVTFHLLNFYLKLYLTKSESKIRKITVKKLLLPLEIELNAKPYACP